MGVCFVIWSLITSDYYTLIAEIYEIEDVSDELCAFWGVWR